MAKKQKILGNKVNINVKPETSEKNHNLQVIFALDGGNNILVKLLSQC